MIDSLFCGRRFRTFNVLDDYKREALAIEIALNLPAPRIIRVLERIIVWRGDPIRLRMDNGPEFISIALVEVRQITEKWIQEYNGERPHDSLNDMTPVEYLEAHNAMKNPNCV